MQTWLRISRKGRPRPGDAALSLPPRPGHRAPRPARGDPRSSGTQSRAGPDPAQPAVTAPHMPRAAARLAQNPAQRQGCRCRRGVPPTSTLFCRLIINIRIWGEKKKKKEKKKPDNTSGSEGGSQLAARFSADQRQTLLIYRSVYELMHVNGPQKDVTKL